MRLNFRAVRAASSSALLVLVASCGGDERQRYLLPDTFGKAVVFAAATDPGQPERVGLFSSETTVGTWGMFKRLDIGDFVASVTVSPDGRYLGGIVEPAGGGCPATLELVGMLEGYVQRLLGRRDCVHEVAWAPNGDWLAVRYTPHGASGADLVVGAAPGFWTSVARVNDHDPSGVGTVGAFAFAADGETVAWVGADGLYMAQLQPGAFPSLAQRRSTDIPDAFFLTPDGTQAVYRVPGETRFRMTTTVYGAPLAETDLTAALTPGDTLVGAALSPTGTHLLYQALIGGEPQLWLVALAAPLGEQRVDAAAPSFADREALQFDPSGTRFAWIGDDGNPDPRVFSAEVATPTTAVALTPTTENVGTTLAWTDADTLVYLTYEAVNVGNVLRSVAVSAPLATVALSQTAAPVPGVERFSVCGDGTVVYLLEDRAGVGIPEAAPNSSALYTALPMAGFDVLLLAPPTASPAQGIGVFDCE